MESGQNGSGVNSVDEDEGLEQVTTSESELSSAFSQSFLLALHSSMETCLAAFDVDRDGCLNPAEFAVLCRALFRNEQDKPYHIEPKRMRDMFNVFDINQDGSIDIREFGVCFQKWIRKIVRPVSALIVVDVQNDFISGTLAVSNCPAKQNGEEVIEPINRLLETIQFDCVYYSLDWHPENHVSFVDNVSLREIHESSLVKDPTIAKLYDVVVFSGPPVNQQRLWPRHCVQNTWGSKLHENLTVVEGSPFIYKGTNPEIDSYSAFWDNSKLSQTTLMAELSSRGVSDVYVCGLAYDVCVGATACDAIDLGYRTCVIEDASRGITLEDIQITRQRVNDAHGLIIKADEVKSMVLGIDRHPELGYKLALELRKQWQMQKQNANS